MNLHNEDQHKNSVGQTQRQEIWFPNLAFDNCVKDYNVKMDDLASLTVKINGSAQKTLNKELQEENKYDGKSNDLVYIRVYKLKFQCGFELHKYPFDKQDCFVMVSFNTFLFYLLLLLVEVTKMRLFLAIISR